MRGRRRAVAIGVRVCGALLAVGACGAPDADAPSDDALPAALAVWREAPPTDLAASLGADDYGVDSVPSPGGELRVTVRLDGDWPADTLSRPTHDLTSCRPVPVAPLRGGPDGVADALVWLVGVTHGPADAAPRRATLALEGCVLTPRLTRVPRGATLLVRNADAMTSRLRFSEVARTRPAPAGDSTAARALAPPIAPRAFAPFTDAGAVTPLTEVAGTPGLVRVTDDHHPWVSGWVAVAPHPFVALSDARGQVAFREVPPGRYVLVVWHERLGARSEVVLVEAGIPSRVSVTLPGER